MNNFEESIKVLAEMFPSIEEEIRLSVLESYQGNLDEAITACLAIADPNFKEDIVVDTTEEQCRKDSEFAKKLAEELDLEALAATQEEESTKDWDIGKKLSEFNSSAKKKLEDLWSGLKPKSPVEQEELLTDSSGNYQGALPDNNAEDSVLSRPESFGDMMKDLNHNVGNRNDKKGKEPIHLEDNSPAPNP